MPRSTFASTTQPQDGASRMIAGTGSAKSQPATRIFLRPHRSEIRPANRLAIALTIPKLTMKERIAAREASANSRSASSGRSTRSTPTIAPTKAFTPTRSANCSKLARRPRRTEAACVVGPPLGDGTAIGPRFERGRLVFRQRARLVQLHDAEVIRRRRRYAFKNGREEIIFAPQPRRDPGRHRAEALADQLAVESRGLGSMARQHERFRGEREQPLQGTIEHAPPLARFPDRGMKIGTAHARDKERVSRE